MSQTDFPFARGHVVARTGTEGDRRSALPISATKKVPWDGMSSWRLVVPAWLGRWVRFYRGKDGKIKLERDAPEASCCLTLPLTAPASSSPSPCRPHRD